MTPSWVMVTARALDRPRVQTNMIARADECFNKSARIGSHASLFFPAMRDIRGQFFSAAPMLYCAPTRARHGKTRCTDHRDHRAGWFIPVRAPFGERL